MSQRGVPSGDAEHACPADSSPPPSAGPSMAATTTFPNISILLLTETAGCANSAPVPAPAVV